jgi:hypothetical protein
MDQKQLVIYLEGVEEVGDMVLLMSLLLQLVMLRGDLEVIVRVWVLLVLLEVVMAVVEDLQDLLEQMGDLE